MCNSLVAPRDRRVEGFVPARQRRAPTGITNEKKAIFNLLLQGFFVPYRGRRDLTRKNFFRTIRSPSLRKQNDIVPIRAKRRSIIDGILADNFDLLHGPKVIIPKSYTPFAAIHQSEPWLIQNINSDDRSMIDRQQPDLNPLEIEVRGHDSTRKADTKAKQKKSL